MLSDNTKMNKHLFKIFPSVGLTAIFFALLIHPLACLADKAQAKTSEWKEEVSFTYAGKCFNGKSYWMYASEKIEDGNVVPYFIYKGPVGSGTVRTDTSPKVMVQRICREKADIVDNF